MDYEKFNYLNEKVFFILDGQKWTLSALYDLFDENFQVCYAKAKNEEEEKEIEADRERSIKEIIAMAEIALFKGQYITENGEIECYRIES